MSTWRRSRYLALALAIAALLVLKSVVFANAGTRFAVDSTTDARDARVGDGVCRTVAGSCTLRAAIQEANALPGADEIQLPAGTYQLGIPPLNQNDVTTGDLDITDSLTISGAGASSTIVDGGIPPAGAPPDVLGLDRLFEVSVDGGAVAFSGLTFSGGYANEYGGAIANNSTAAVTVDGSSLTGNVAEKAGGAIDNHLGGTVEVRDSTLSRNFAYESGSALNNNRDGALTVTNSTVSANSAAVVGLDEVLMGAGAISNNAELDAVGSITVIGSQIADNRSGGGRSGATISNDGAGTVVVEGTTFAKNHADGDGGAIFNGSGEVRVADSTFTENAAREGGAIYSNADKGGLVSVRDSAFSLNSASAGGGALVGGGTGVLEVLDSTFAKNSADEWGGAVLNEDKGSVTIGNSSFSENSGLNGGGFANEGSGLVTVESSTFTKNTAFVSAVLASGEGGGMHSNSGGELVVSGGGFTDNKARSGGGLSNEGGGTVAITGTRFAGNSAEEQGGGILIQSGAVHMLNIDVVGNVADSAVEGGGGIAYAGDKLVGIGETAAIEQSRIRDNKASGPGGGIDSRGDGPLSIATTSITGNSAPLGGAIHHVGDAPLDVTRSTLSGNFAESGGGVFSDGDGEATVENSTISANRAGQFGGGLLVSSRLHVRSSTVAGNTAASGGGINNGGGDLVGDGSVFLLNTIVAGSPTGGNCAGTMTSLGGNLDSADSCQLRALSDQPGTDPRIGPLTTNGGPTQTHALLAGSPAQENAVCTEVDPCPSVDQRGVERPRFDGFDIGAYESELTPGGGGGPQGCAGLTERPVLSDFDSWVSQSAPGSNLGNDAILRVESQGGGNERALVHFDLPPVPPGCKLVSASLRLYSAAATGGRTLEAVRIASDWTELGVTWSNQPSTAGPAATTQSGLETREWDVLAQTLDMYAHGEHGFLIRDGAENGSGEQSSFHSGEKGPEHPPVLVLVFDDPDPSPQPGTCPTTPQSLSADRDSWVSEGSPANNFGTDSTLKVKSQVGANSRALVRFPLPTLPAGCTSIASATLRVDAASAKEGRTLEALQIAAPWTETGVTWGNQPGVTGPAVTTPSAEGPLEWPVTEQILGMYTSANHGLMIRDADENGVGDEQTLTSRHKVTDSPPELVLAFDDSTPETMIDAGPDAVTDRADATFSFSSDRGDAKFECSLDGAAFTACASPYPVEGLAEGDHVLEVRATRRVRAVDPTPASYPWKVAIPPETTIDAGPASPSASPDAAVSFSADDREATFECSLNGAAFEACTSPAEYRNLADGENEVRVRATDSLGSVEPSPAAHVWRVAVPPETTIESGPPALGNSTSASFEFSGTDNGPDPEPLTFECSLDGGDPVACASGQTYRGLADGPHTFEVRATDGAGNGEAEPASRSWTVDTVAPVTTIDAGPREVGNSTAATFEFGADEPASFECRLDGGDWVACASPHDLGGLSDGEHTLEVRAIDRAGNEGAAASRVWTVDTVSPDTTIGSGPADLTNSPGATFEFDADEPASFQCQLDAGEWGPCSSPQIYGELGEGEHTFQVQATDQAGNPEAAPAVYTWTVDTTPPETTLDSRPADPSNDPAPSFEFSADEAATFQCKLDVGDWAECASPHQLTGLADGEHTFQVEATDKAGNGETAPEVHTWTVDTTAPKASIDAGPSDPSNRATAGFEFSANEAVTFECQLDAGDWAPCSSGQAYADLPDGEHTFQVRATDRAGNQGDAASLVWTVDTVAPETTIDSGPVDPSNSAAASFEFHASEAATFECALDAGEWAACGSPQDYAGLADGDHTFQVRATDRAGNQGGAASRTWTVDTVAPDTTIDGAPSDPSNDPSPSFDFRAGEAASFECKLDAGPFEACSSGHAYAGLADGVHRFSVQATDRAGNREAEPAVHSWTIDTVVPRTTITAGPPALTNSAAASFEFGAGEAAGFECKLDAGDWADCSSPRGYEGLADGGHTFQVRATDPAGNQGDAASWAWTVDTTAPAARIDAGPRDPSNSASATFEFSAGEEDTFECKLDAGDWAGCTSPQDYVGLPDGEHTFQVRGTDKAGNQGAAASWVWTVGTVAPDTTIDSGPTDPSNRSSATFEFSAGEAATFECQLDAGDWLACSSGQAYADLADGEHTFQVRATDRAGNGELEPASYTWTVDTVAPETTIASGPPDPTNSTAARFEFSANETASLACRLDAGDWAACSGPQDYAGLAEGEHTFQVQATDPAGNEGGAASWTWTIDTTAPNTTIDSHPADPSNSTSASFEFSAGEDASFECQLDSGPVEACSSGHAYTDLADGEHSFSVQATDAAGNTESEPAVHRWTIDTAAPDATITSGPPALTKSAAASFEFSAGDAAVGECKLDAGDWATCASPQSYTDLADGEHTFQVRGTDPAGNEGGAASWVWSIDTQAPDTTIDSGPSDPTKERTASFEFGAGDAAVVECKLDAGDWATCASPQSYTDLADGEHTFQVRGTDKAGNQGPAASGVWTVDTGAPDTTIAAGPRDPSNSTSASFEFSAGETASFECQLDSGPVEACSSGHAYTDLADGDHRFSVQATDLAGNAEAEAAVYSWTIDTVAPETTIDSGPADPTTERTASFEFRANEAASFDCRLDAGDWAACSSGQRYGDLADGRHTFQVQATDAAGNLEAEPASYSWTIEPARDGTAPDTILTGQPANPSNSTSATFSFTGSDNETPPSMLAFECRLDSQVPAAFTSCSSPSLYSSLSQGSHTFEVRAVDLAGNPDPTPVAYTWTIDTAAPQTTIASGPAAMTSSTTARFVFSASEQGSTFECALDGAAFTACSSPRDYTGLADGGHQFSVRAMDAAGNTEATPASFSWTVDTAAPQTTITSAPPATTSSTNASFGFTASESASTFECSLDGAAFTACASPREYTGLAVGTHQFSVRARDAAGNIDATPAGHQWAISAPPQGCGSPATASAASDSWLNENNPTVNKGTDDILKVRSKGPSANHRALVLFSLPAVPEGCVVESATLRLYAASATTGRTLHALPLAGAWSENQVTWDNQPETTGTPAATTSGLGYREWTVTSHVQAMYGGANHGFLIRDAVEGQEVAAAQQFHSRESGQNPPQLVLRFAAGGG